MAVSEVLEGAMVYGSCIQPDINVAAVSLSAWTPQLTVCALIEPRGPVRFIPDHPSGFLFGCLVLWRRITQRLRASSNGRTGV